MIKKTSRKSNKKIKIKKLKGTIKKSLLKVKRKLSLIQNKNYYHKIQQL